MNNNYSEQSTNNLVLLTLAGDQNAYEALVIRYEGRVLASAKAIVRSDYMAEDAAQDAFVTAWLKLDTLNAPEKFGIWVSKIAKNSALRMAERFRDYIDIDSLVGFDSFFAIPFEDSLTTGDDYSELHKSIDSLSDKVKRVICLYYFEGLSIAQIAAQMSVNVGTVKRHLHDGRQKIRKDLCSMNERLDDTLVERVMKKVEEFRFYWRYNKDLSGFADSYKSILREVEELPEYTKKDYALAEVLQLGWWYSGEQSDEALARLKEASQNGKNEEVMTDVMNIEHNKLSGKDKIKYMHTVQIPYLEKIGFNKSVGYIWFWIGREYLNEDIYDMDKAAAAFNKALELLEPEDAYYSDAIAALKLCDCYEKGYDPKLAHVSATAYDIRMHGGKQILYSQPGFGIGNYRFFTDILYYAVANLNILSCHADVGETVYGNNCSAKLISNSETVETPAGTFGNCELWEKEERLFYIKPGIGIVKGCDGLYNYGTVLLGEYKINMPGNQKMPFDTGNSWVYVSEDPECVDFYEDLEVIYSEADKRAVLSSYSHAARIKYNENSWEDMKLKLEKDYYVYADMADPNGDYSMFNIPLDDISRLEELADTPYRKLCADKAGRTMRRIIESNPNVVPNCREVGIWNFFEALRIETNDGISRMGSHGLFSFEWKQWYGDAYMLLHNFMFSELNNCGALWNDDWKPGYSEKKTIQNNIYYPDNITVNISCSEGGTVTTAAGTFENCLNVTLEYSGFGKGHDYMNGKKEYFFAKGIGIVKCIHHNGWAIYELKSYEGTGEGYMPLEEGISRIYEGVDFPGGMRGEVDFTCTTDDRGRPIMILDLLGQQNREDWDKSDQPAKWLVNK